MHLRVAASKLARFGKEDVVEQFADVIYQECKSAPQAPARLALCLRARNRAVVFDG